MKELAISWGKKLPIPDHDYSSCQASISLNQTLPDGEDVETAVAALFMQAKALVDAQLAVAVHQPAVRRQTNGHTHNDKIGENSAHPGTPMANNRPRAGRPAPPSPVTTKQLGLLRWLMRDSHGTDQAFLTHHGIERLEDLDRRQASELIDQLRGVDV